MGNMFKDVLDALEALVYVVDMATYEVLYVNDYGRRHWGEVKGRICWQALEQGQSGPCAVCTNPYLLDEQGSPKSGSYVWEYFSPQQGRWYECHDRAMFWAGGRLARLEIALDISQRKQAEAAESEQRALAEALSSSAAALNSSLDLNEVLDRILESVGRVVVYDLVQIFLLDEFKQFSELVRSRSVRFPAVDAQGRRFLITETRNHREMLALGAPRLIADTASFEGWVTKPGYTWIRSNLGVPIVLKGEVIGFFSLSSAQPNAFNAQNAALLQAFANQAATAIANARLYEKTQALALKDILTGVYNRVFFETELERLERGREFPVSIIVTDLDNLKVTNDRLGHPAGDELLKNTARLLQAAFRAGDILARIGGDEFALLLPHTDAQTAGLILARVRASVAQHNAGHPDLPVEFSLGAVTALQGEPILQALARADRLMYEEKARRKGA